METLKLTDEQAMEALKVPEEEKPKYAGMLKEEFLQKEIRFGFGRDFIN